MSEYNNDANAVHLNDIQAQRIARRNKIIDNAKERLRKLNDRVQPDNDDNNDVHYVRPPFQRTFSDPAIETEEQFGPKEIPSPQPNSTKSLKTEFHSNANISDNDIENVYNLFNMLNQHPPNTNYNSSEMLNGGSNHNHAKPIETKFSRFLRMKLHLIIISLITYFIHVQEIQYATSLSVFLPLFIWELTETFFIKSNTNKPNVLFNVAFMMIGMPPNLANTSIKVIGTLNQIFQDAGVFVFFFVFCHLIHNHFTIIELTQDVATT